MKKIITFITVLFVGASLFAIDGDTGYSRNKNDLGLGVGYISYYIQSRDSSNDSKTKLEGPTVSFISESTLFKNKNSSLFLDLNILLPSKSYISDADDSSSKESLDSYSFSSTSAFGTVENSIFAFDTALGIKSSSMIGKSLSVDTGFGLHMFLFNNSYSYDFLGAQNSGNTGYFGFGGLINADLIYQISENILLSVGASGTYDIAIYEYDANGYDRTDYYSYGIMGKALIKFRLN